MAITYKGFELKPAVEHLRESGLWSARALITKHNANEVRQKFVSAANTFSGKAEAEQHSLEFAKQVVDGNCQNATIEDLL
ncbi:MAG: HlyU family transcriptional regulator [Rhodoferax sp.]|nr:HlyU family transcriptional regulator [Rhodoferax sp.]